MRLYNFWRSSASYRVRLALAYKGLDYEYVAVNLLTSEQRSAEHLARNPLTTVPVLEVEEGGKPLFLSQSMAIAEYLDERFPEKPLLFPGGLVARAHIRILAEYVNSGIQPLQNLTPLKYLKEKFNANTEQVAHHWITEGLRGLEEAARATAGKFAVGDAVSFADFCIVPQLATARRFNVELSGHPTLLRVEASTLAMTELASAHPAAQPDAVK